MKQLLLSPERSSLILGLKALARMAVNDENNSLLQDIPIDSSIRVQQLLLLEDDEELVNAALDFLYQFTTYKSNVQTLVAKSGGMIKLVDSLVRLMGYGAKQQKVTINVLKRMIPLEKLNAEPPTLSSEILSGLLKLNEPERCIQWYRVICVFLLTLGYGHVMKKLRMKISLKYQFGKPIKIDFTLTQTHQCVNQYSSPRK